MLGTSLVFCEVQTELRRLDITLPLHTVYRSPQNTVVTISAAKCTGAKERLTNVSSSWAPASETFSATGKVVLSTVGPAQEGCIQASQKPRQSHRWRTLPASSKGFWSYVLSYIVKCITDQHIRRTCSQDAGNQRFQKSMLHRCR